MEATDQLPNWSSSLDVAMLQSDNEATQIQQADATSPVGEASHGDSGALEGSESERWSLGSLAGEMTVR